MHNFYIPVMGTGFTIDTPLKVAPFGISSVISVVDDKFIEQMFKHYCEQDNLDYEEISERTHKNWRADRVKRYLNLINKKVNLRFAQMKTQQLEPGTDLYKYFEVQPDSETTQLFNAYVNETDTGKKAEMQSQLINSMELGRIDVNIMTKLNRVNYFKKEALPKEYNDALFAFRGFAESDLDSAIIFSAGMNAPLYTYLATFDQFFPDNQGHIRKKVIIKVSDYRSSFIQGKFFAKKGIWPFEFRIESGLNCGGHAFATEGLVMGPTMEEFRQKGEELKQSLYKVYQSACEKLNKPMLTEQQAKVRVTFQGGIAHHSEDRLLREVYPIDQVGWGSPFLFVKDAVNMDPGHLDKLSEATESDVHLSNASPLGVPFWNLKTAGSEILRLERIASGKPGSACPKGFLVSNTEFSEVAICTAGKGYQRKKLKENNAGDYTEEQREIRNTLMLAKACICHDLAGTATGLLSIDPKASPCICCGPNTIHFSKPTNLVNMVKHINGKTSDVEVNPKRHHVFINELNLYISYLIREITQTQLGIISKKDDYFLSYKTNLESAIAYYREHVEEFAPYFEHTTKEGFLADLKEAQEQLAAIDPSAASFKSHNKTNSPQIPPY
ncbi:MAG: hypothetical protein HOO06_01940 [Bdellovibrionaceae bacterium]|jgi:hypothetical protein|nr:hypothetical protein [Pseudobdellovibrionaceae bacterium]